MVDGYAATYDSGETSEVAVDFIVSIGAALVSFASIIGLILLYTWLKKRLV